MRVYWVCDDRSESLVGELDERAALIRREAPDSAPDVLVFAAGEPLRVCDVQLGRAVAARIRGLHGDRKIVELMKVAEQLAPSFVVKRSLH